MSSPAVPGWENFPATVEQKVSMQRLSDLLGADEQLLVFSNIPALSPPLIFGIKSSASGATLIITLSSKGSSATVGKEDDGIFTLSGEPHQWQVFFTTNPTPPFHSYWGIRFANFMSGTEAVGGNLDDFVRFAHIWRRTLELLREVVSGAIIEHEYQEDDSVEDHITGRYAYLTAPSWGRCKVYYERSGTGERQVVFIHTAGSDSRQFHAIMNDADMRQRYNMLAFDLPSHGKSLPDTNSVTGAYKTTEDDCVAIVASLIRALDLQRPIVCGASMAGNICLALAIRAEETGIGGVIPLEACEHIAIPRWTWDRSPYVNQSLFNPESVYPTMSPTAPTKNKRLMWHTYSAQAYGILAADLDFTLV